MAATPAGSLAARALDELYRRHVGEVYRYAYAMLGNSADAEDVAQTTFVNALRALERGERPRKPPSWLLAIAHNIVRQRFRQAQARPAEVELDRELAGVDHDDDAGPTVDELLKALIRIPPGQREAIVMREFEGRTYTEIAEILGITSSAFESLLFRARRSLADELANAVTCEQAELAISHRLDERLSRKKRRRLEQHLSECATCARFEQVQRRGRRAFKGLTLLPLPVSLTVFKGTNGAAAAASLPTIGVASVGAGGGAATGGLAAGGLAVKAAALVAAVGVAGGVGYTGVREVRDEDQRSAGAAAHVKRAPAKSVATTTRKLARGTEARRINSDAGPAVRPNPLQRVAAPDATARGKAQAAQAKAKKQARKDRLVREPPGAKPHGPGGQRSRGHGTRRGEGSARVGAGAKEANTARGKAASAHTKEHKSKPTQRTDPRTNAVVGSKKNAAAGGHGATGANMPPGQNKPKPERRYTIARGRRETRERGRGQAARRRRRQEGLTLRSVLNRAVDCSSTPRRLLPLPRARHSPHRQRPVRRGPRAGRDDAAARKARECVGLLIQATAAVEPGPRRTRHLLVAAIAALGRARSRLAARGRRRRAQ